MKLLQLAHNLIAHSCVGRFSSLNLSLFLNDQLPGLLIVSIVFHLIRCVKQKILFGTVTDFKKITWYNLLIISGFSDRV